MNIEEVTPDRVPMALLLEADPSEAQIREYLDQLRCFAVKSENKIVGACLILQRDDRSERCGCSGCASNEDWESMLKPPLFPPQVQETHLIASKD